MINDKSTKMEINTGASLTLISECTLREHWPDLKLSPSRITLHSYSGESIPVLGTVDVVVKYVDQTATLPLLVVKGEGPSLDWHEIFWLQSASLKEVLDKHKAIFEPGLGKVTGYEGKILLDPGATPKYCKARSVPYFYQEKVRKSLIG